MAELKSSSTAGGSLVWTQTNLPVSPQDGKIFYKDMELVDSKNNQTIAGKKDFTTGATVPTPVLANDATNKSYVDGKDSTSVKSVRGTAPIRVTTGVNPTVSIDAATPTAAGSMSAGDKTKLDNHPFNVVNKDGDTVNGNLATTGNFSSQGKITSTANAGLENMDDVYAQRILFSGSQGYVQAGKKDRDVNDQKMVFSGWFGTPLSQYRISMANGVQPQVLQGGVNYDILHRGNMPTPEDIKAMAIYDRPTGDDCNNAILPGNYGIFANTTNTPFGTGPSGSTLLVTRWGGGANAQIFFTYSADRVFVRRQYVGVWQPWFELYSTVNKQPVGGMGLGIGDAPNALTITGNVRDFNLAKTNGNFTIDGNWANGVDNTPTATGHTGILQVSQRSFDNMTIQKFSHGGTAAGATNHREYTRIWINNTEGWSDWVSSGVQETVNTYRTGILRRNNLTGDDSVYPYVSYTKEKYRDTLAAGVAYTIGEIGFRAGSTNRYDPHTGDQLARILGMAINTTTAGEYDGGLFLASRLRRIGGTVADSSTVAINRTVGVEFTHASKKVQINTGRINADEFLQNTAQSSLVNSSTRKDYVDSDVGTKVSKSGDTMTGALRMANNIHLVSNGVDKMTFGLGAADVFIRNVVSNKYLQLKDTGSLEYSNQKIYHEGYKPTSTELGVVNIAGDTMTGNLVVDAGPTKEPQIGVSRSGRRLYLADNGTTVGIYNIIGGSFINTFMISRNINDGNITVGSDSNNTIIRGAGNLKHGTADIYTTSNKPTPGDIGTLTTAQINSALALKADTTYVNSEIAKQVSKTGDTMTGNLTAPIVYLSSAQNNAINAATRKDYVDGAILGSLSSIIPLRDTDDLDNIKTAGFYSQTANVKATTANHYPVGKAGNLVVTVSAGTIQKYWVYNSSEVWSRAQYAAGAWTTWVRDYNEAFKPSSSDVGAVSKSGDTMTGTLIVANRKSAIKVDGQSSISLQDQSQSMFHLMSFSNSFRISTGTNAENNIFSLSSGGTLEAIGAIYGRAALISQNPAGTTWLGLETPASSSPYISVRATGDSANRVALTFNKGEIVSNTDTIASNNFRVGQDGGLIFSPHTDRAGVSWGMGINASTGNLGIHKYVNGAYTASVMYISPDNTATFQYGVNIGGAANITGAANIGGINVTQGYMSITGSNNTLLEFHTPGKSAAMIYKDAAGNMRFVTSNGAGAEANLRMNLSNAGALEVMSSINGIGGVYDVGQRVYSPNNPQPRFGATVLSGGGASAQIGRGYSMYMAMVTIRGQWVSISFTEDSILTYGATVLNMGGENADRIHSGSLNASIINANTLNITIAGNITAIGKIYGM